MVSIGQCFVVTSVGIDLSVGSMLGLATVWATTGATQYYADQTTWLLMVFAALAVGVVGGLLNGIMVAYGKIVPFMATLALMVAAKGLAEWIANRQTQIITVRGFENAFNADPLGIPTLVWIFALVAGGGWVLYNRTTFGRRTVAIGGNIARLGGIDNYRTFWCNAGCRQPADLAGHTAFSYASRDSQGPTSQRGEAWQG